MRCGFVVVYAVWCLLSCFWLGGIWFFLCLQVQLLCCVIGCFSLCMLCFVCDGYCFVFVRLGLFWSFAFDLVGWWFVGSVVNFVLCVKVCLLQTVAFGGLVLYVVCLCCLFVVVLSAFGLVFSLLSGLDYCALRDYGCLILWVVGVVLVGACVFVVCVARLFDGWIWFGLRCGFGDYVVGWVWFDLVAMLVPDVGFGAIDCVDSGAGVYVICLVVWVVVFFYLVAVCWFGGLAAGLVGLGFGCAIVSCFGFTDCGLMMFVNSVVLIDSL